MIIEIDHSRATNSYGRLTVKESTTNNQPVATINWQTQKAPFLQSSLVYFVSFLVTVKHQDTRSEVFQGTDKNKELSRPNMQFDLFSKITILEKVGRGSYLCAMYLSQAPLNLQNRRPQTTRCT